MADLTLLPVATPPPTNARGATTGNWPCPCGHEYRVLTEPLTFWPRNSPHGFSASPAAACVTCGIVLEDEFALELALLWSRN